MSKPQYRFLAPGSDEHVRVQETIGHPIASTSRPRLLNVSVLDTLGIRKASRFSRRQLLPHVLPSTPRNRTNLVAPQSLLDAG